MHKIFCKVLRFFNLVDRSCNLSISNIAVIVCITKIAMAKEFTITEVGALMVTLMNYMHKRNAYNKAQQQVIEQEQTQ